MAKVTVFVDDAVLGELPPVCAKTGVPTPDHLVMTVPVGGSQDLGVAWLLLLLGPLGWLGLAMYASVGRNNETLTVRLPYCDAAYHELAQARRTRRRLGYGSLALFFLALVTAMPLTFTTHAPAIVLAVLGLGLLILFFVETRRVRRSAVRVQLDGSRRWVTLSGVSDGLAEAVISSRAEDRRRDVEPSLHG